MLKMTDLKKKIFNNYKFSLKNYKQNHQSNHWSYNNNKKKKLFVIQKLKNFRRNSLSEGMDDKFYTKNQAVKLFEKIKKECGKNFVYSMLLKKNLGNSKKALKEKSYYYTAHELFHIKFIHEIKKKVFLKKKDIICEIGPAYGSMIGKLIKLYNSKVILIDLPEANFISYYYLKKQFPKKKFFVSQDIKNNDLTKKNIIDNDIIILCPWDKLPKIKINLFINARSMMEMKHEIIKSYFKLIQNLIVKNGFFLCVNRYYKDTVGYPVELNNYPYDQYWKVLISKRSWMQDTIHFLLTKRTNKKNKEIRIELNKIKKISEKVRLSDKFFFRRVLPNFIYKLYKKIKFLLLDK
jgi:putative sugar O-methyltransferase